MTNFFDHSSALGAPENNGASAEIPPLDSLVAHLLDVTGQAVDVICLHEDIGSAPIKSGDEEVDDLTYREVA